MVLDIELVDGVNRFEYDGTWHTPAITVKVGDKVIFSKYSGTEIKYEDTEYTILKQSDILAIVE